MPEVLWLICICIPERPATGTAYALHVPHIAMLSVCQLLAVGLHCLTYCHARFDSCAGLMLISQVLQKVHFKYIDHKCNCCITN